MVKEQLKDLVLIYPENWKICAFVNETLDLFPELDKCIIPVDTHLFVKNLVMPEVKPWTPMVIPEQVLCVRELIFRVIQDKNILPPAGGNIYLSRKDAARKNFENEKEVGTLLKDFGYQDITMGDKTIFEQAAIMKHTKNLVSITGAGMANFIFINEGANILDLPHKAYLTTNHYKFHFWKIANLFNTNYFVQFCEHMNNPNIHAYSIQNIFADICEMKKILTLMESLK